MPTKGLFLLLLTVFLVQDSGARPHSDDSKITNPKGLAGGGNKPLYHEITNRMAPKSQQNSDTELIDLRTSHKLLQGEKVEINVKNPHTNEGPASEHMIEITPKSKAPSKKKIQKKGKSLKAQLRRKNKLHKSNKGSSSTQNPKPSHSKKKSKYPKKYNAKKHGLKKSLKKEKQKKQDRLREKRAKKAKSLHKKQH